MYIENCKQCGKQIVYESTEFYNSVSEHYCGKCNKDVLSVICKQCGKQIVYRKNHQALCRSCAALNGSTEQVRRKISVSHKKRFQKMTEQERKEICHIRKQYWTEQKKEQQKNVMKQRWSNYSDEQKKYFSEKNSGSNNPMYGRTVYQVWLQKYGKEEADRRKEELKQKHRENLKGKACYFLKIDTRGKNNPMYGRTVYQVWLQKYGKEEADRRKEELRKKKSQKFRGKNNPMYGKPAPKGSGNGISGWYKGWYFRSLRELSYMIQVIEKEGHKWRSLDNTSDFRIKYIDIEGKERSYCPDFLIDDKVIVQIKPEKLQICQNNQRKQDSAILFSLSRNLEYRMIDVKIMQTKKIKELYQKKIVIFNKKSQEKVLSFFKKSHLE